MSYACFSGLSSDAFPSAALIPPSAAPEWLRTGWIFEIDRDVGADVECLDRGAHPCAARADDDDVVLRVHDRWKLADQGGGRQAGQRRALGARDGHVRDRQLGSTG